MTAKIKDFLLWCMAIASFGFILFAVSLPVWGQSNRGTLRGDGMFVVVWKSADAHAAGIKLMKADAPRDLVVPHIACVVVMGTDAMITSYGLLTHDIIVLEGRDKGCKGNIPTEHYMQR